MPRTSGEGMPNARPPERSGGHSHLRRAPYHCAAVAVLGHRDPNRPGHLISPHNDDRLRRAERHVESHRPDTVVFSGWSSQGPSEAAQMAAGWQGPPVHKVLEDRSRTTAENAARCIEVLERLGIDNVTIVSSAWHLRAPLYFRELRRHGIRVHWRFSFSRPEEWPRLIRTELRGLRTVRRERLAAMATVDCRHTGGLA